MGDATWANRMMFFKLADLKRRERPQLGCRSLALSTIPNDLRARGAKIPQVVGSRVRRHIPVNSTVKKGV